MTDDKSSAYYRLDRIDGTSLPVGLEYGDGRCVVTDGDLVLLREDVFGGDDHGDGTICIRLFGSIFGLPQIRQISLERYAFDRLDSEYLTFPGGWRHRQGIPPDSVVRRTDDGLELSELTSDSERSGRAQTFRAHRWSFVRSLERLPDSDAESDE